MVSHLLKGLHHGFFCVQEDLPLIWSNIHIKSVHIATSLSACFTHPIFVSVYAQIHKYSLGAFNRIHNGCQTAAFRAVTHETLTNLLRQLSLAYTNISAESHFLCIDSTVSHRFNQEGMISIMRGSARTCLAGAGS